MGLVLIVSGAACTFSLPEPRAREIADGGEGDGAVGVPADMVRVPAGAFLRGCNESVDTQCYTEEKPSGQVTLSRDYEIDRTEVTKESYARCVTAGACTPPSADDPRDVPSSPVRFVTWEQARAYCSWAGKRLPTEAEWEKAARGTDGRIFPWGNEPPTCERAHVFIGQDGCGDRPVPVGSHPSGASPYGALDMCGNVHEWVEDWFAPGYPAGSATDPTGPASGTKKVFRGGDWENGPRNDRTSTRGNRDPTVSGAEIGFRCAR